MLKKSRLQVGVLLGSLAVLTLASWVPAQGQKPAQPCSALASVHIENTIILSAKEVAEEGASIAQMGPPIPPQPAHCVVEGIINKHAGADGNEYGDKFQLRLPDAWTGR